MRKNVNQTNIEGYLYQHDLKAKVTGEKSKNPGTNFISGTIDIATDNALTNIVSVHFTYVTATTSKGSANPTYNTLMNIINGMIPTVMGDGVAKAGKIQVSSSAIGLNEFISERSGTEELVSAKRNEGGFVRVVSSLNENENERATFKCDMIATKTRRLDADENGNPEKMIVTGYIFDFRNALLPVDFVVYNPAAMNWIESMEVGENHPLYMGFRGRQISQTVVKKIDEEGAWSVYTREVPSSHKEYVIEYATTKVPYLWDDEGSITAEEYKKALQDRELVKADVKRRNDEWKATRNSAPAAVEEEFHF